jgi:hypothetical protein
MLLLPISTLLYHGYALFCYLADPPYFVISLISCYASLIYHVSHGSTLLSYGSTLLCLMELLCLVISPIYFVCYLTDVPYFVISRMCPVLLSQGAALFYLTSLGYYIYLSRVGTSKVVKTTFLFNFNDTPVL